MWLLGLVFILPLIVSFRYLTAEINKWNEQILHAYYNLYDFLVKASLYNYTTSVSNANVNKKTLSNRNRQIQQ